MTTKKKVLITAFAYIPFFSGLFLWGGDCYDSMWCRHNVNGLLEFIAVFFASFPIIFLFSLITYKLPDLVFTRWWHFTRWFVSLSIFLVAMINSGPDRSNSSLGHIGPSEGALTFFFMMSIYIIVSTTKIIRAYRESKKVTTPPTSVT